MAAGAALCWVPLGLRMPTLGLRGRGVCACRVCWGVFSSTPGFYPPEVTSTLPRCDQKVSRHCHMWGGHGGSGGVPPLWVTALLMAKAAQPQNGKIALVPTEEGCPKCTELWLRIKLVSASSVFLLEALPGAARTWDELGQAGLDALMALLPRDTWSPHLVPAHCSGYDVGGQPVARPSACLLPVVAEAHSSRL